MDRKECVSIIVHEHLCVSREKKQMAILSIGTSVRKLAVFRHAGVIRAAFYGLPLFALKQVVPDVILIKLMAAAEMPCP